MFRILFIIATLIPSFASAAVPTRLGNGVIAYPYIYPDVTGRDLGATGTRWNLWTDLINGTISSTELGFLDGVTSSIQDQIDAISGSALTGPGSSVDNEIALWNGVTGSALKRATTTGVLKATSGVLSAAVAGTDYESPLTFSTPLSRSVNTISCDVASGSQAGCLSSSDFTTFNNKVSTSRTISTTAPLQGGGDLSANRTLSVDNATEAQPGVVTTSAQKFAGIKSFEDGLNLKERTTPSNPAATYHTIYAKSDGKIYHLDSSGTETELGSGAGTGTALQIEIAQTAHGFVVGDIIYFDGSDYLKAKADAEATSEVLGVVSEVVDANNFKFVAAGYVSGLSGLTAGVTYYLSAATSGAFTATEPTTSGQVSKPVLVADSTTSGYVIQSRGVVAQSGGSGATGVASIAKSGSSQLTGNVTLSAGTGISLTQASQDISIANTGLTTFAKSGGATATGAITISEGSNITITKSGNDFQIAAAGGGSTVYAWYGYNRSDCAFTVSNSSFDDFSGDSTCTLTEEINSNFGTVSKWDLGGGSFGAGLTFSPPVTGIYEICAGVNYQLADGVGGAIRLYDFTNAAVLSDNSIAGTGTSDENQNVQACAFYNATSTSSRSIIVRGASTGGSTITITNNFGSPTRTIQWRLKKIN